MSLPTKYTINWDTDVIGSTASSIDLACKLGKLEKNIDQLYDAFVDTDAMTEDSDAKYPSQQSTKAYYDLFLKTDGTKARVLRAIHVAV